MTTYPLRRYERTLVSGVEALHARMKRLSPLGLTHDEFLHLFAPKEHHVVLKTAAEVAAIANSAGNHQAMGWKHHKLDSEVVSLSFAVSNADGDAPLMPRNETILKTAPKELVERITSWVNEQTKLGLQFANARALIDWLNVNCETKQQVRFIWPSLLAIASLSEFTADLGEKLRDFKAPRALPAMPFEVREACKASAGLIASAMLLDSEPVVAFQAPVVVSIYGNTTNTDMGALGIVNPLC